MGKPRKGNGNSAHFGLREFVRSLSGRPAHVWPHGVSHHGTRLLLLIALAFAVHLFFPAAPVPDFPILEKGMVAEEDIIAEVGFPIRKTEEELSREREEAAASVPAVFDFDPSAADSMRAAMSRFFARIDTASAARNEEEARERIRLVLADYGFSVTPEAVNLLSSATERQRLAHSLDRAVARELPAGVVATADLGASTAAQLRVRRGEEEVLVARDSVITQPAFYQEAGRRHLPPNATPEAAELQRLVLIRFFEPSLRLNQAATEAARERARQAVSVVKGVVVKGEKVIGAHEQVRDADLERLRAYQAELAELGKLDPESGGWLRNLGSVLFNLLVLSIFGFLLLFFRPGVYGDIRHVLLLASLILAVVAAAAVIDRASAPVELIPVAVPALVVAALWDGRMALNMSLILAVLLSGQTPFLGITALFVLVMGGAAAALSVRVVRRRAQTWVFISIISAAYVAAALALGLMRSWEPWDVLWSAGWGTLNAIASALLAMGFLPLLESFTRITTDQTLLELADLSRPLLKRLSLEAPGTYAHSISVANLAEAAARAVEANPLLARVGAYYHDIGKVVRPQYFIENQPQGRNPHDKLKPGTSASIVRNHVLEGLRLADEAKLPDSVKAFVAEHHGTQPIGFFLDKAREDNPEGLNPADFSYPGPKPRGKETAILMLADSVESAARVLHDPTPERIRALVNRIVDAKIAQGQLDETPLTLRDLTRIKEQFVAILSGMYHHRIDYPMTRELSGAPATVATSARDAGGN